MGPFYDVTGPLWSPYFFEFPQKIIHFSALFGNPKESRMPQDFFVQGFQRPQNLCFDFFLGSTERKIKFFWFDKNPLEGFPKP
jgi:hypothetical protein